MTSTDPLVGVDMCQELDPSLCDAVLDELSTRYCLLLVLQVLLEMLLLPAAASATAAAVLWARI